MVGSKNETKRSLNDGDPAGRHEDRSPPRDRRHSNIVPIGAVDDELLDALRKVGEDILTEPTPQRLLDALHGKKS
jgi:hypothetical protein